MQKFNLKIGVLFMGKASIISDEIEINIQQDQLMTNINNEILQKILWIRDLFLEGSFEGIENKERVKKLLEAKIAIQHLDGVLEVIDISLANTALFLETKELFKNIWEININSFSDPQLLQSIAANSVEIQWQNPIDGQLIVTSGSIIYTELTGVEFPLTGNFEDC
jgi:hypothetical protein